MSKVLKKDEAFESVSCPDCGHKWHEKKELAVVAMGRTIYCPACSSPLHPPVMDIPANIYERLNQIEKE